MKMLLIGLGKCEGAKIYHRAVRDFSFEPDRPQRGRRSLCPLPHPGRAWRSSKTPTTKRPGSRPFAPDAVRAARAGAARPGPAVAAAAAVCRGRRAVDRSHRQGHQRHGPRSERGGAEVQRPSGRRGRIPQGVADRAPRPDRRHARQRHRHGHRRILPLAALARNRLRRHAAERRGLRPHFRRHGAAGLRNRSRNALRSLGNDRPGRAARRADCCGSPTRCTWAKWSARPPISRKPANAPIWKSSPSPATCRSTPRTICRTICPFESSSF